jgi:hypothetical protein
MFPQEASIAQAKLESMGIDSFLQDELTTQVISVYSNALGGAKLQVWKDDAERARHILMEGGFIQAEEIPTKPKIEVLNPADYPDQTRCPYCASTNIDTEVNPNMWVVIFYFILGIILPIFKSWEICYDCNKKWKYKK